MSTNNQLPKTELHAVTKFNLFQIQVCSLASEDDALAWVRGACPAGTTGNWMKQQYSNLAPITCVNGGGRTHYMFEC